MPLQDITITASINSIATQSYGQKTYIASTNEQSFPIEEITGSYAGAWPNFEPPSLNVSGNYTVGLVVNVTQSWSGSNITPLGYVPYVHNTMEEFINGEFSGSSYTITDGNLTDEDCQPFLEVSAYGALYSIFPYVTEFNLSTQTITYSSYTEFFHRYTVPNPGQILLYIYQTVDPDVSPTAYTRTITHVKINRIDQNGNDNTPSLEELDKIIWIDSVIGKIILNIVNITEYQNYYFYEVTSDIFSSTSTTFIGDDSILDYTLTATNFPTIIQGYNYITSSWSTVIDTAGGFNISRGYYSFPLTPNIVTQITTSISITVPTATTFSYAINAYDPIYPQTIPNALYSINNPLQFNTYTQSLASNVFYLNAGTHNLSISGSGLQYDFIQNYIYKIDAYLENSNIAINENGLLSGSVSDPTPPNWESVESGSGSPTSWTNDPASSGWVSSQYFGGSNFPLSNGVVYYPDITVAPSVLRIPPTIGPEFPWVVGTTYGIDIYIPPSFEFSNLGTFGPSLAPLTCSTSLTDPISPSNIIGYIPSGASGLISFTRTAIAADDNFNIFAPLNAADTGNKMFPLVSWIRIYETGSALADIYWYITQSQSPQNSTSSLVLEPYLYDNFYYSDCDVLINNFSQNDISDLVQEVLYDSGGTVPSNIEQIISGTAQQAEINDYLYELRSNTLPRYAGVRTTSQDFNTLSTNGFSNEELAIINTNDISFGSDPNVENTTTYFAYFSSLKSNNPIFKGTTSPIIKYLIGEDGTTYNPSSDNASYYNLSNSFPKDSKAYCNLLYETSPIFNSTQSIILSGESYTPILYNIESANASIAVFTSSINFDNLQGVTSTVITPPSYSIYVQKLGSNQTLNSLPTNSFYDTFTVAYDPEANWTGTTFSSNIYDPGYIFDSAIPVSVKVTVGLSGFRIAPGSARVRARIWIWDGLTSTEISQKVSNVYTNSTAGSKVFGSTPGSIINHIFTFTPNPNDRLYVTLELIGGTPGTDRIENAYLKIESLGVATPTVNAPFWYTGSANSITITSSLGLGAVLQGNYQQVDIENSGFDPIQLPCEIQVGDEIRFEYDEANTYKIIAVEATGSGTGIQTILTLDKVIPTIPTLDINHFTVRRKIKDAITGISFNAGLLSQVQDGFLLPEYPSQTIKSNISNIIQDLIQKGVI